MFVECTSNASPEVCVHVHPSEVAEDGDFSLPRIGIIRKCSLREYFLHSGVGMHQDVTGDKVLTPLASPNGNWRKPLVMVIPGPPGHTAG